jgi:hypothetical protein
LLLGFGESLLTHDRPYLLQSAYHQAAALTLAATVGHLEQSTSGCTQLAKTVTVAGSSEGGYAAITTAYALRQLGLRIRQVRAAGPLLNLDVNIRYLVQLIDEQTVEGCLPGVLPLTLFSLSNDFPGRANAGSSQTAISPDWSVPGSTAFNVFEWIRGPEPLCTQAIEAFIPPPDRLTDLVSPEILEVYRAGIERGIAEPCAAESGLAIQGETDLLCEAITDVSLWNDIRSAPFPLELCYSELDDLVTISNFPSDVVDIGNDYVTRTTEIFPGIPIPGGHGSTLAFCNVEFIRFFVDPKMQSDDPPNKIVGLDNDLAASCPS